MFQPQSKVGSLPLSSVPLGSQASSSSGRPYSPGALDVMNQERSRQGLPPLQGREDVRERDAVRSPSSTFSATSPLRSSQQFRTSGSFGSTTDSMVSTSGEPLQKFERSTTQTLRPVIFQPNGSFRALKENGKLRVGPEEADLYKGRVKNPLAETAYHLPGYTGFVRGSQHISGRTFGETSRRALGTDYREIVCSSPVPSSPQANRKIRHEELQDTFVANMFGGKTYHLPGYTGFVPGVRHTYAKRYGAATEQELFHHSQKFPRQDNQSPQFARTQLPRASYPVSSAPLPGGSNTHSAPEMYIPNSVKYLKFLPM